MIVYKLVNSLIMLITGISFRNYYKFRNFLQLPNGGGDTIKDAKKVIRRGNRDSTT